MVAYVNCLCGFGIGTNLTNDLGVPHPNIVMKLVQCNGFPYLCPGSDPVNPSAQGCYHVCGDLAASEAKDLVDGAGAYRLRGEVPVIPVTDTPLADSASGYRLVPR